MGFLLVSFHSILANIFHSKWNQIETRPKAATWGRRRKIKNQKAAQFYATIPKGVIGLGAGAYGET